MLQLELWLKLDLELQLAVMALVSRMWSIAANRTKKTVSSAVFKR